MSEFTLILTAIECAGCHMIFGMTPPFRRARENDHGKFYCPKGCVNYFPGQSETEAARAALQRAERKLQTAEEQRERWKREAVREERRARAYKGHFTRTKRRIAHGSCPACAESFDDLRAHMEAAHPHYMNEENENDDHD